jgi:DNA-binding transcriptional MerR regulator/methylmalonyl-CoA mutase cobalamin-binding subunit
MSYSISGPRTDPGAAGDPLYPIRTVSTLTGVNPITLRAWERRYGLVTPKRTAGGHRVYTRKDIDRIHHILAMIENGVAIGRVNDALSEGRMARARVLKKDPWTEFRGRMTAAISQFDENRLEDVYNELLSRYPLELVTREVLLPLLVELGERWSGRIGGVAEEHFFAVYLRNKLGARFHHRHRTAAGPRLLAACLPGEHHETGLLLFALAAHEHGFRVVLLGADMPLAELGYAARSSQADAIVLSGSIEPEAKRLDIELPRLVLEAGVPVLVGGLASVRERDAIVAAGAVPLGTDIGAGLRHLRDTLAASAR